MNSAHYTGLEVEASDLSHTLPKVRNLLRDTKGLTHLREVNLWGLDESRYYLGKAGKPWFQVEAKPEDKHNFRGGQHGQEEEPCQDCLSDPCDCAAMLREWYEKHPWLDD